MKTPRRLRPRAGRRPTLECLEQRSLLSVTLGTHFTGMDIHAGGGYEPPDTNAAVGPNNVVEMVNTAIAVYDKSGNLKAGPTQLSSIFNDGNLSYSDPQITYDEQAGQYFIGAIAYDSATQTSHFDYAILNSSDASVVAGSVHSLDVRESDPNSQGNYLLADFPRVGWNADAYFVTFNMFEFTGGGYFDHVQEITIPKPVSSLSTVTTMDAPGGSANFTLVPATMHDATPGGPEWFVEEAGYDNGSLMNLVRLNDPLTNPNFTEAQVSVPSYGMPPSAPQPGGRGINTGDTRILSAVERGGHLLATQNVGTGGDAHARWYDFTVPSASLYQYGEINPGSGIDTYYPAIEINASGDIGLTYMESSRKEPMSMYVTGRSALDTTPLGTMQTPQLVQSGQGTYSGQRAGDYSGISVDPINGSFWAASEYATSPYWGTAIANFSVSMSSTSGGGGGGTGGGHGGVHGGPKTHHVTYVVGLPISPMDDPLDLLLNSANGKKNDHGGSRKA